MFLRKVSDGLTTLHGGRGVVLPEDVVKSAQEVLVVAGLILEHLREENASRAGPWN
jgi:hypothetical protein